MTRYKVKVSVELVECDESISDTPTEQQDGSFSMVISEKDAVSIDKCEKNILKPHIRQYGLLYPSTLPRCLKKKADEMSEDGEQVIQNSFPYKVDGEVGRFTFFTHSILKNADVQYNTDRDVFSCLRKRVLSNRRLQRNSFDLR